MNNQHTTLIEARELVTRLTTEIEQTEATIALYQPMIEAYQEELAGLARKQLAPLCAEVFPQFPSLQVIASGRQRAALLKAKKDAFGYEALIARRNELCEQLEVAVAARQEAARAAVIGQVVEAAIEEEESASDTGAWQEGDPEWNAVASDDVNLYLPAPAVEEAPAEPVTVAPATEVEVKTFVYKTYAVAAPTSREHLYKLCSFLRWYSPTAKNEATAAAIRAILTQECNGAGLVTVEGRDYIVDFATWTVKAHKVAA